MKDPIPDHPQEVVHLRQNPVSEELVAAAIVGVIQGARSQGQSLADLRSELLKDDSLLDKAQRRWLSDLVTQAWGMLV
ncbi:hypothetical protein BST81_12240 [Leptolyngbya sp. 'hensonii']|uniref:hypothetical protein n=1 Tax=Leptolyngbya sp. 'hensonii' TaxID=1922337 RepID=UPI0009500E94|nr:hypothetical protein [Leptolyngbya sp. 'hensonii']OLP17829.1 hypothetical protein BST81_12240 [Leptolyngbya sp. 'hensonii']